MLIVEVGELREAVVLAEQHEGELPERGEVRRLVESACGESAVAEESDGHAALTVEASSLGGSASDRDARADDAVGTEDSAARIGDVHRPTAASADPGLAAHELGVHLDGCEAAREGVGMASMCGGDDIVVAKRKARAHGRGLLANRQVDEAGNVPGTVEDRGLFFEAADSEHPSVQLQHRRR